MNERHDIDFTIEKDNRKANSRKRITAVPSEWKIHKTKLLRNTGHTYKGILKEVLIYLNGREPLVGPLVE
jgi:histone deacetylase complex regulatory component SIN3